MSEQFALYGEEPVSGMDALEVEDGLENGNPEFELDSTEILPLKEGRIIRKAKRPSKQLNISSDPDANGLTSPVGNANANKALLLSAKNSRRPRNLKGRGLPKKGESTWLFLPIFLDFRKTRNT